MVCVVGVGRCVVGGCSGVCVVGGCSLVLTRTTTDRCKGRKPNASLRKLVISSQGPGQGWRGGGGECRVGGGLWASLNVGCQVTLF